MGPVFPSSPGKFVEEFGVSPREGLTRLGAVKENALGLDTEEIVSVPEEAVGIAGLVGDHFGPVCHSVLVRIEENLDVAGTVALMARAKQVSPASSHLLDQLPEADRKSMAEAMVRSTQGWNNEAIRFAEKHLSPNEIPSLLGTLRGVWKKEPRLRANLVGFMSRHGNDMDRKLAEDFSRPPASEIDLTPFAGKMKAVDWEQGDQARGQATYARYNCATCHSGNKRLGPSLRNIAKRFNREDLFRHINEPNLALSDLYKATQITTADGVYVGMKVYSSESQTILETGSNETIRFSRHDIISEQTPNQSPMPAGLLVGASREDLADLYAYLKTL